jgi:hypothetical protein
MRATFEIGHTLYSAYPPFEGLTQTTRSPRYSPCVVSERLEDMETTVPSPSQPRMHGFGDGYRPLRKLLHFHFHFQLCFKGGRGRSEAGINTTNISIKFTAAYSFLMRTSSSLGTGIGRSVF